MSLTCLAERSEPIDVESEYEPELAYACIYMGKDTVNTAKLKREWYLTTRLGFEKMIISFVLEHLPDSSLADVSSVVNRLMAASRVMYICAPKPGDLVCCTVQYCITRDKFEEIIVSECNVSQELCRRWTDESGLFNEYNNKSYANEEDSESFRESYAKELQRFREQLKSKQK